MPSYEFHCTHHRTPRTQTIVQSLATPLTPPTCPTCKRPMQRTYGVNAVTFKGTGFYSNDKRS